MEGGICCSGKVDGSMEVLWDRYGRRYCEDERVSLVMKDRVESCGDVLMGDKQRKW